MFRQASVKAVEFFAPPGELDGGKLRVMAFVNNVVDLAAEGVERRNGLPPFRRQKKETIVR